MNEFKVLLLCLIIISLNISFVSADLNYGLIGYYPLNGNAYDSSGNGYDGTENGGIEYVNGIIGQGAKFDGSITENIKIDKFPEIKHNLTISTWVKPNNFEFTKNNPVITRGYKDEEIYTLWVDYTKITLMLNLMLNGEGSDRIDCAAEEININDNQFYHIVAIYNYDYQKISIFLDGDIVHECSYDIPIYSQSEPLFFGSSYPGDDDYFKGIIDEIRIYNRALSDKEVQELFHEPTNNCTFNDSDNDGVIDQFDDCEKTPQNSWVNKNGCRGELRYTQEQMNHVINTMLDWDKNKDGKIGLVESINILQEAAGVPIPYSPYK